MSTWGLKNTSCTIANSVWLTIRPQTTFSASNGDQAASSFRWITELQRWSCQWSRCLGKDLSPNESEQSIPLVDGPFHLASDDGRPRNLMVASLRGVGLDGRAITSINIGEILTWRQLALTFHSFGAEYFSLIGATTRRCRVTCVLYPFRVLVSYFGVQD